MRWRFTDKVLAFTPWRSILSLKAGSLEEYGLLERWGEPGQAPAILLLESCLQAARWLVEASSDFSLSLEPLEIRHWPAGQGLKPGECLCWFVQTEERNSGYIRFIARQRRLAPGERLDPAWSAPVPDNEDHSRREQNAPWPLSWTAPLPDAPEFTFTAAFTPLAALYPPADRACLWREICA